MKVSKYFEGRLCRRDYIVAFFVVLFIGGFLFGVGLAVYNVFFAQVPLDGIEAGVKYGIFIWLLLVPALVKRLHDVGSSGLVLLIGIMLPSLVILAALFLLMWPSNKGENKFGLKPTSVGGVFKPLLASSLPNDKST